MNIYDIILDMLDKYSLCLMDFCLHMKFINLINLDVMSFTE